MKLSRLSALALCAALVALLPACVHVEPATGYSYFLHTDYELFHTSDDPARPVSNFVGYCMLPMEDPKDTRATIVRELTELYLRSNAYVRVTRDELLAEPRLIPHTFLVGVGYVESFAYETIQLQLNLYYVDQEQRTHVPFWSWKAKYDGYPLARRTVEPALRDLFVRQPMDWNKTAPIFPRRSAPPSEVTWFYEYLAAARLAVRNAPPPPPLDTAPTNEYNDTIITIDPFGM